MKVGFIGTGRMGGAMVSRLLAAKHDVGVHNRTPDKLKPLADQGAKIVASIADAARYGDVIYTMLADDTPLEDVPAEFTHQWKPPKKKDQKQKKKLSREDLQHMLGFVKNGGGLFLTGERICCEPANRADEEEDNQHRRRVPIEDDPFATDLKAAPPVIGR